jgi:hypothetical protein
MRFINPKTDFAFKKIFGSNESKSILISFLNAMIYGGNSTITDLENIDPYLPSKVSYLKDSYLDVQAKLLGGQTVIIEMHLNAEELKDLEDRERYILDQQGVMLKGIEEGLAQGMQQGMREKAVEIARQLLNVLDDRTISQTTGLSVEDIQKLREE